MITDMTATMWDESQADALLQVLQKRGVSADRLMAVEFVSGMVDLVADVAGISTEAARETITPTAVDRWADNLASAPSGVSSAANGEVLVPASTVAAGLGALLALLGQGPAEHDIPPWGQVSGVAMRVARIVLEQTGQEMLRIPSTVYMRLCRLLDESMPFLPALSVGEHGDVSQLHEVITATLHELDLAGP
ncbi:MAG: hypothetical protein L0H59_05230 [Tomitella sp.]|nr:hypothetical protein [Tomitella sp.]